VFGALFGLGRHRIFGIFSAFLDAAPNAHLRDFDVSAGTR